VISVDKTINKCRASGMRITAQRVEILKLLEGNRTHPTAEEIFRDVKKSQPAISRATVYNTINILVELDELRELVYTSGPRRFDPDLTPHDHAVCIKCGGFFDVKSDNDVRSSIFIDEKPFKVKSRDTTYHGLCQVCANSNDS